jgi:hypothetical protein
VNLFPSWTINGGKCFGKCFVTVTQGYLNHCIEFRLNHPHLLDIQVGNLVKGQRIALFTDFPCMLEEGKLVDK